MSRSTTRAFFAQYLMQAGGLQPRGISRLDSMVLSPPFYIFNPWHLSFDHSTLCPWNHSACLNNMGWLLFPWLDCGKHRDICLWLCNVLDILQGDNNERISNLSKTHFAIQMSGCDIMHSKCTYFYIYMHRFFEQSEVSWPNIEN